MPENVVDSRVGDKNNWGEMTIHGMPRVARGVGGSGGKRVEMVELRAPEGDFLDQATEGLTKEDMRGASTGFAGFVSSQGGDPYADLRSGKTRMAAMDPTPSFEEEGGEVPRSRVRPEGESPASGHKPVVSDMQGEIQRGVMKVLRESGVLSNGNKITVTPKVEGAVYTRAQVEAMMKAVEAGHEVNIDELVIQDDGTLDLTEGGEAPALPVSTPAPVPTPAMAERRTAQDDTKINIRTVKVKDRGRVTLPKPNGTNAPVASEPAPMPAKEQEFQMPEMPGDEEEETKPEMPKDKNPFAVGRRIGKASTAKKLYADKLDLKPGDVVVDVNDPTNLGIFLETQDSKPGDIDLLIYFLEPQVDGHQIIEISPLDLKPGSNTSVDPEQVDAAFQAYEEWQGQISERDQKHEDKTRGIVQEMTAQPQQNDEGFSQGDRVTEDRGEDLRKPANASRLISSGRDGSIKHGRVEVDGVDYFEGVTAGDLQEVHDRDKLNLGKQADEEIQMGQMYTHPHFKNKLKAIQFDNEGNLEVEDESGFTTTLDKFTLHGLQKAGSAPEAGEGKPVRSPRPRGGQTNNTVKEETAADNGPTDEDVELKAREMFNQGWADISSKDMDAVYKALGYQELADGSLVRTADGEMTVAPEELGDQGQLPGYEVGDRVRHPDFGQETGKIVEVDSATGSVNIQFKSFPHPVWSPQHRLKGVSYPGAVASKVKLSPHALKRMARRQVNAQDIMLEKSKIVPQQMKDKDPEHRQKKDWEAVHKQFEKGTKDKDLFDADEQRATIDRSTGDKIYGDNSADDQMKRRRKGKASLEKEAGNTTLWVKQDGAEVLHGMPDSKEGDEYRYVFYSQDAAVEAEQMLKDFGVQYRKEASRRVAANTTFWVKQDGTNIMGGMPDSQEGDEYSYTFYSQDGAAEAEQKLKDAGVQYRKEGSRRQAAGEFVEIMKGPYEGVKGKVIETVGSDMVIEALWWQTGVDVPEDKRITVSTVDVQPSTNPFRGASRRIAADQLQVGDTVRTSEGVGDITKIDENGWADVELAISGANVSLPLNQMSKEFQEAAPAAPAPAPVAPTETPTMPTVGQLKQKIARCLVLANELEKDGEPGEAAKLDTIRGLLEDKLKKVSFGYDELIDQIILEEGWSLTPEEKSDLTTYVQSRVAIPQYEDIARATKSWLVHAMSKKALFFHNKESGKENWFGEEGIEKVIPVERL